MSVKHDRICTQAAGERRVSTFERCLTLRVVLCIVAGIALNTTRPWCEAGAGVRRNATNALRA